MRSPVWRFATSAMGSDLPSRDTFISTRGPVKSNAAACALAAWGAAYSAKQPKIIRIRTFRTIVESKLFKNTTGSLSGLGGNLFFVFEMHRVTQIIAGQQFAPRFSACCVRQITARRAMQKR